MSNTLFWWFHATPFDLNHQQNQESNNANQTESISSQTQTSFNEIKSQDPQSWTAFSVHDNERLEAAFHLHNGNVGTEIIPVLEDYLYSADLSKMTMKPYYWDDFAVEIRRSCWFYLGNGGKPVPMSHAWNVELEESIECDEKAKSFFSKLKETNEAVKNKSVESSKVPNENNSENVGFVVVPLKSPKYSEHFDLIFGTNNTVYLCDNSKVRRLANSILSMMNVNFINPGQKLCRGYCNLGPIFEKNDLPVPSISCDPEEVSFNHLVIVIHGMGQKHALKSGNPQRLITASCNQIRSRLKNESLKSHSNVKAMILPIPWRNSLGMEYDDASLHAILEAEREILRKEGSEDNFSEPETLDALLRAVTLSSVPVVRNIISDVIMDVMLYLNSKFSPRILDLVVSYLNSTYEKFIARHATFRGKVSIFAHSLGSVITFDVLKEVEGQTNPWLSRLLFKVENVFVAGSPISVFLGLEGIKLIGCSRRTSMEYIPDSVRASLVRLKCKNFFNIFHPNDPISYRLEPTICRFAYPKDPHVLPYRKGGLNSIQFSNFINRLRHSFTTSGSGKPITEEDIDFPDDDEIRSPEVVDNLEPDTDVTVFYETPANTPMSSSSSILNEEEEDDDEFDDDDDDDDDDYKSLPSKQLPETGEKQDNDKTTNPLDTRQWLKTHFNSFGRVDFVLQNPISLTPSLLNSLPAHLLYWKDDDVMSFIHSILKKQLPSFNNNKKL